MSEEKITCNYCKKTTDEVAYMVASSVDKSYICDACVFSCVEIIIDKARKKNLIKLPIN